jgi:DNA-binding MarR family transcriptional regulator
MGFEAPVPALADFRYRLRKFLQFSEAAAARVGLDVQQHQLLLQIAGAPAGVTASVGYLAERLVLRHHTVVELGNRCEAAGLVVRRRDARDRRQVVLDLTEAGERLLNELSADHARELHVLGPELIRSLEALVRRDRERPAS